MNWSALTVTVCVKLSTSGRYRYKTIILLARDSNMVHNHWSVFVTLCISCTVTDCCLLCNTISWSETSAVSYSSTLWPTSAFVASPGKSVTYSVCVCIYYTCIYDGVFVCLCVRAVVASDIVDCALMVQWCWHIASFIKCELTEVLVSFCISVITWNARCHSSLVANSVLGGMEQSLVQNSASFHNVYKYTEIEGRTRMRFCGDNCC